MLKGVFHFQIHQSEKQFDCPSCPMRFRHKNSLVRHLCQHTGERPYHCPHCDSTFVSMHRMKDHFKKCHEEETKQPATTATISVLQPQPSTIPLMSLVQGTDGKMYLISQPTPTIILQPQQPTNSSSFIVTSSATDKPALKCTTVQQKVATEPSSQLKDTATKSCSAKPDVVKAATIRESNCP